MLQCPTVLRSLPQAIIGPPRDCTEALGARRCGRSPAGPAARLARLPRRGSTPLSARAQRFTPRPPPPQPSSASRPPVCFAPAGCAACPCNAELRDDAAVLRRPSCVCFVVCVLQCGNVHQADTTRTMLLATLDAPNICSRACAQSASAFPACIRRAARGRHADEVPRKPCDHI